MPAQCSQDAQSVSCYGAAEILAPCQDFIITSVEGTDLFCFRDSILRSCFEDRQRVQHTMSTVSDTWTVFNEYA